MKAKAVPTFTPVAANDYREPTGNGNGAPIVAAIDGSSASHAAVETAVQLGAELNAAIQEEWPAAATHAKRFRWWLEEKTESLNGNGPVVTQPAATAADGDATS